MDTTFTTTRLGPTRVAPETFVIHHHAGEGKEPVVVALNSMVIRGSEPVVVDTGVAEYREQYFEDLFSIVEPDDVRWVFISHDDIDHTGNLNEVMARCPNATLIVNWFITQRMGTSLEVPPMRWRWIGDGERFEAGDRVLEAVRPPVYDSPTTCGLFDPTTGVYWASDAFASPMLSPVTDVADIDPQMWQHGMATFNNYIAPWLAVVDLARYESTVDRIAALRPTVLAGTHTATIRGEQVDAALEATRGAPTFAYQPQPDQFVLDQILASMRPVGAAA